MEMRCHEATNCGEHHSDLDPGLRSFLCLQLVLSFISQWHEQYVHVMTDNPQALLVYVHAQM